jgi:hypothetical protein
VFGTLWLASADRQALVVGVGEGAASLWTGRDSSPGRAGSPPAHTPFLPDRASVEYEVIWEVRSVWVFVGACAAGLVLAGLRARRDSKGASVRVREGVSSPGAEGVYPLRHRRR